MIVRITYSNIDHLRHCGCGANGLHLCGLDIHGAMNVGMMLCCSLQQTNFNSEAQQFEAQKMKIAWCRITKSSTYIPNRPASFRSSSHRPYLGEKISAAE